MKIGMTTQTKYTVGGVAAGAIIGMIGTKVIKGHFCWLCIAGVAVAGGLGGYFIGKNK